MAKSLGPARAAKSVASHDAPTQNDSIESPSASDEWYMRTEDGTEYGPVSRQELDAWMAEDRIEADYHILEASWDQWKWAAEVYPELDEENA